MAACESNDDKRLCHLKENTEYARKAADEANAKYNQLQQDVSEYQRIMQKLENANYPLQSDITT